MQKSILIIVFYILLSIFLSISANAQEATLHIENASIPGYKIKPAIFGNFIEYLHHYINGPRGMWAQELQDRSFDLLDYKTYDKSLLWFKYGDTITPNNIWQVSQDRYNENGNYAQLLETKSDNKIGIGQYVYLNDSVSHTFYIYHKGTPGLKLYLQMWDKNDSLRFSDIIGTNTSFWKKSTLKIPPINKLTYAKIILTIRKKGKILLDEASLMPDNNIHGIRNEIFNFYAKWQPGIYRYPGGCFADYPQNKLEYCIGPIDKRQSPNITWRHIIQRMDFGLQEFIWLCDTLNIEPHITLNYENSSPEEAARYVEYCNGDTNTEMGKLRKSDGHPKPFNIKYFEIGNEQWTNDSSYATNYLKFYKAIKRVSPDIKVIINGNHWIGNKDLNNLFSIVGTNCDIYSFHPVLLPDKRIKNKDSLFLFMSLQNKMSDYVFNTIDHWMSDNGFEGKINQGISEWWSSYPSEGGWTLDTNILNSSLEIGISAASFLISIINHCNTVKFAERTQGIGLLRCNIDSLTKQRVFFATPSYYALSMLRNHSGNSLLPVTIESNYFFLDYFHDYDIFYKNQYIYSSVTKTKDTIFIAIINRYLKNNIKFKIRIDGEKLQSEARIYYLWSNNVADANTLKEPEKVKECEYLRLIDDYLILLPHSFYIIAVPIDKITYQNQRIDDNTTTYYPNPFSNYLNIEFKSDILNQIKIKLFDLYGNNINLTGKIRQNSNRITINTGALAAGTYFIQLVSHNKFQIFKVIKIYK